MGSLPKTLIEEKYDKILPKQEPTTPSTFWDRNKKLIIIIVIIIGVIWTGVQIYLVYFQKVILPQIFNQGTP